MYKCCKHKYKDNDTFNSLWSSFGFTSAKPPKLTNRSLNFWDQHSFCACLLSLWALPLPSLISVSLTLDSIGFYCPGTYGQLMELPDSCMSRIRVSMGVLPTSRMKKSWEMRFAGTARRAGRRSSKRPKRCGWFGYCNLSYSVRATWAFSCRDSTWAGSVSPHASGEKSAMALRQLYSAVSTCSRFSLSTWSWKTLTWSINDTTRSADMGDEWNPAAASRGAMWRGKADWAAFRMNSSLQLSLSRATCSETGSSGKYGMFLAHSTVLKRSRAASSQMLSMPMTEAPLADVCICVWPYGVL